ncbi:response regulator [Massilia endophytica]|uniref:response regulator n=1 Tax=Massilia endophytica TaxID=2899220 RepID=UPI001E51BBEA|nr:response regulator [Massilia endophytica]UGQ48523.1 response regulator [Massilia endophytica]
MQEFRDLSVLIVDPNPGMRGNLHNMLSQSSITKIEYAVSSGTAIRQLSKSVPDIILCEYDLGSGSDDGQDGQQLLEDLRHHKLISPGTIFIMLTSEGVYSKVIGAAELTPTDYVLKPFTADALLQRITRAVERRTALLPVYQHLAQGNLREAVRLAAEGAEKSQRYAGDFARLRAETLMELGDISEAEIVYQSILLGRPLGWAQLGLARCQFMQQRHAEAQQTLTELIQQNPRFMAAYDLLARTYEAQGEMVEAKRVLEDAVSISPHMVRRLRHLGEVALNTDDIGVAEKAFRQVVTKAKYSEFRDPEDHVNLVKTLIRKGDAAQASSVIRDLERSMRGSSAAEVCKSLSVALVQDLAGNEDGAVAELAKAAAAAGIAQGLSPQLRKGLAEACLKHYMDDQASDIVRGLMDDENGMSPDDAIRLYRKAGREDLAEGLGQQVVEQLKELMSEAQSLLAQGDHRGAVTSLCQALRRAPGNVPILVAAARASIRQLDELGWEAPLGEDAAKLLARIRGLDPYNEALESLQQQYSATQRKYGISTTA